jgi:uncharacterized membrane protein
MLCISFIASLASFRLAFPFHLKLFSILLGCTVITELFAIYLYRSVLKMETNMPLYNCFTLVEYWAYAFYFRLIIESRLVKQIITVFLFLFPPFWFITTFLVFGINNWNSYLMVAGSLSTVCLSFAYCYQVFIDTEMRELRNNREFWIATGLIFFYSCQLPYVGTLNFLLKNYLYLAQNLLVVLQVLNIVMYAVFTYAFLCRITTKKSY